MDLQVRIITIKYKKCDNVRTNVTVKRVRITIFAVECNNCYVFLVCVCSLSYIACDAHVSYYIVICGLSNFTNVSTFFYVLLTVHLSIFISVINQLDAQNFCFAISLFHTSACFEHMCSKHVEV